MSRVFSLAFLFALACGQAHEGGAGDSSDGGRERPADCSLWYTVGCPFANADTALPSGWLRWDVVDWRDQDRRPLNPMLRIGDDGMFHFAFANELGDVFYAVGTSAEGFVHELVASGAVDEVEPALELCAGAPRIAFALADGRTVLAERGSREWQLEELPFHGEGGPAQPALSCHGGETWLAGRAPESEGATVLRSDGSRIELPHRFFFNWLPATKLEIRASADRLAVLMNRLEGPVVAFAAHGDPFEWEEPAVRTATLARGGPFAVYEAVEVSEEPVAHDVQRRASIGGLSQRVPIASRRVQGLDAVHTRSGVTHLAVDAVYEVQHAHGIGDDWAAELVHESGPGAHPALDLDGERPWLTYRLRQQLFVATHPRDWSTR